MNKNAEVYVMEQVIDRYLDGICWNFVTQESIKPYKVALIDNQSVKVRDIGNTCVVDVDMGYLLKILQGVNKMAVTEADLTNLKEVIVESQIEFDTFLLSKCKKNEWHGTILYK